MKPLLGLVALLATASLACSVQLTDSPAVVTATPQPSEPDAGGPANPASGPPISVPEGWTFVRSEGPDLLQDGVVYGYLYRYREAISGGAFTVGMIDAISNALAEAGYTSCTRQLEENAVFWNCLKGLESVSVLLSNENPDGVPELSIIYIVGQ